MSRTPLIALWISTGFSRTASTATFIAIPWFVLMTTGSATRVGVVTAAELLGLLAASAVSGPIIDRLGPRRIAIVSDVAAAAVVSGVPLIHFTESLQFWQLVVLAAALGATREPGQTSRRVAVPELVVHAGVTMERGAGGVDAANRTGLMLGAPLAGAALVLVEAPSVLVLNSAVFLLAALLISIGVPSQVVSRSSGHEPGSAGYLRELGEGLRYLRHDRLVAAIIALLLITNMFDAAVLAVFFPAYAVLILHSPVALGAITGVFGGAALVGNLVFTWSGHRAGSRHLVFTVAFLIGGVSPHVALASQLGLPAVLVVVGVAGLAAGTVNPILAVVTYERVPGDVRGRVLSLTTLVGQGGMPLGVLFGGVLVDGIGLVPTLWATAGCYFAATLVPMLFPVWRKMDGPAVKRHESLPVGYG